MSKQASKSKPTGFLDFIVRPLVTVDIAIFTVKDDKLQVLLVKRPNDEQEPFANCWALPGGFLDVTIDQDLNACALRKLKEKTNVNSPYLEQVGAWGSKDRDPRGWSVTHVYFALLSADKVILQQGGNAAEVAWFPITNDNIQKQLAFDHNELLSNAIQRLQAKVEYTSLPAYLLPDEFTLPDLQKVYEIVLDRHLDKSSFRTRILATNLVEPVTNKMRPATNRPAQIYRLTNPDVLTYFPRSFKYNEKTLKS
ncbi:NUDIX hydrolase [Entomomonas sp. E2T0]|uniref:NUDIX hydrolase n=1 Tax=Entomomonas sp. E2T0 TaxID=2930213 RepID=UPI0022283638|nr:NUDIX hydrolase [Entomomonas sp. E2T0]UYZ84137.1 NUDIX hydrolase [Entomomonas sp. E2T0]